MNFHIKKLQVHLQKIQVLSLLTHLKNIFRWLENISNLSLIFYFICGIEWIVEPNSSHLVSLSRSVKIIKIGSNSSMSAHIVFHSPLNIYESKYAKQNSLCSMLKMNYLIVTRSKLNLCQIFSHNAHLQTMKTRMVRHKRVQISTLFHTLTTL